MALQIAGSHGQIPNEIIIDTDLLVGPVNDVTGTSGTFYLIDVNNARGQVMYLKLYDAATATAGTTVPDWIFEIPNGTRRIFSFPDGISFTNLTYSSVQEDGTGGTTALSGGSAATLYIVTA